MFLNNILVAAGTFSMSYIIFRKFPYMFISNLYRLHRIKKFDNFIEVMIEGSAEGPSIHRPICHKIDKNIKSIVAKGTDIYGEHNIHLEVIDNFVVGLPLSAKSINYKYVTVKLVTEEKIFTEGGRFDVLHKQENIFFADNDIIDFGTVDDIISLNDIIESDVSE